MSTIFLSSIDWIERVRRKGPVAYGWPTRGEEPRISFDHGLHGFHGWITPIIWRTTIPVRCRWKSSRESKILSHSVPITRILPISGRFESLGGNFLSDRYVD